MARRKDSDIFVNALKACGGRASNAGLQARLSWNDDKYWRIHASLYESGIIEKGRGYSGIVILVPASPADAASDSGSSENQGETLAVQSPVSAGTQESELAERDLYEPARRELHDNWHKSRGLDHAHVDNVALQGRKETGGSWSRPDLAVVALRTFEYLPNRVFEIHTFEVKPSYDVTVKGVMEALTHREFATRSYVIYHTAGRDLSDYPEAARIEALAARHGIGVYAAKSIAEFKEWAEIVPAERTAPDPDEMELFIKRSLSEEAKVKIRKWLK